VNYSCKEKVDESLLISTKPTVFEDILEIDGVAQSVESYTIQCPPRMEAEVIFLIEDGAKIDTGDVVCILENKDLQSEYENLLIQLEEYEAGLSKSHADLAMQYAMMEAQVKSIDAQTAIANLDSLQLSYATPKQRRLKELEMEKAAIEKQKLTRKLEALETINKSQIRKQELQIQRWKNRIKSTKERLDMCTLKANHAGIAIRANSWLTGAKVQEGDQAWSNMPLITIPDLSKMKVIIQASESEYKRININDSVEFTFDAMPENKARGRIRAVSPVGKAISQNSKVKVFDIEATIDSAITLPDPGFTAKCKIVLRRVPNVIVIPQIAIFDVDSQKVVYVKRKRGYEERQVITGITSPKSAVIDTGLTGKEMLSLIRPSASLIKKQTFLPDSIVKRFAMRKDTTRSTPNVFMSSESSQGGGMIVIYY